MLDFAQRYIANAFCIVFIELSVISARIAFARLSLYFSTLAMSTAGFFLTVIVIFSSVLLPALSVTVYITGYLPGVFRSTFELSTVIVGDSSSLSETMMFFL